MPRRPMISKTPIFESQKKSRYSSVTLPKDFIYFLDKLIFIAGREEANDLPSRRAIVQDAVEFYIKTLMPDLLKEYQLMLKECNMHRPLEIRLQYERSQ